MADRSPKRRPRMSGRVGRPGCFTAEQVSEWRKLYDLRQSLPTYRQMADRAGVSRSQMYDILTRRAYKWVRT